MNKGQISTTGSMSTGFGGKNNLGYGKGTRLEPTPQGEEEFDGQGGHRLNQNQNNKKGSGGTGGGCC